MAQTSITQATVEVPALWDTYQTAEYLKVSPKWLERDRWKGATIPYVKVGRSVRYRASDVLAYLAENSVDSERGAA